MTTASLPIKRMVLDTVVNNPDPSVVKFALACLTIVVGMVLGSISWIVTAGGDVTAVSLAIAGVVVSLITSVSKLFNRKKSSG